MKFFKILVKKATDFTNKKNHVVIEVQKYRAKILSVLERAGGELFAFEPSIN